MRILLVEDENRVAGFIAKGLREQSYAVDVAADGDAALYQAAVAQYDLVVLDVMLPGKNGHAVCRELRAGGFRAPKGSFHPKRSCGASKHRSLPDSDLRKLLHDFIRRAKKPWG